MIKNYRLTGFFVLTALIAIGVAMLLVSRIVDNLSLSNLEELGGDNTLRDARHIQSMLRHIDDNALSLDALLAPEGLLKDHRRLTEGLNIEKLILFDNDGIALWSTDAGNIDTNKSKRASSIYWRAAEGEIVSKLVRNKSINSSDGVPMTLDIIESYIPITVTPSGEQIGVLEIYRDVTNDVALLVIDTKALVLQITAGTMGVLFLELLAFVVVADIANQRSRKRETALFEDQLDAQK